MHTRMCVKYIYFLPFWAGVLLQGRFRNILLNFLTGKSGHLKRKLFKINTLQYSTVLTFFYFYFSFQKSAPVEVCENKWNILVYVTI